MAAFLHRIPLPALGTAAKKTDGGADDSSDGLIRNDRLAALATDLDETNNNSFCYHAIAVGETVVGILPSLSAGDVESNNDGDGGDASSSEWQTKFDAPVLKVISNTSGTIIACATATHVSLLKGHDGSIIATRQITRSDDDLAIASPGLVFVSFPSSQYYGQSQHQSAVKDVLVVVCPVQRGEWHKSNVIVISNIDGEALNSSDPNRFREGATNMSIDALYFDDNNVAGDFITATLIEGVFINDDAIRFFIARKSGTISVYDYNVASKRCTFVTDDLFQQIGLATWKYEEQLGMSIDTNSNRGLFLVLAACSKSSAENTSIGWINVADLSVLANYPILAGEKLMSLKPLRSNHPDDCVVVAFSTEGVTSRKRAKTPKIFVLQSYLGKEGSGSSQILFTIQTDPNTIAVEICSPPALFPCETYSFRFASKFDGVTPNVYNEFVPNEQGHVGTVHYLLTAKNDFDDAHNIIAEKLSNFCGNDDVISTPIHKSLVWLWKFRHILSTWNGASSLDEYQQSLRQLTFGAATGDDQCTVNMIAAAEFMFHWPGKCSNCGNTGSLSVSLHDIQSTLSILCSEMKRVLDVFNSSPKQSHLEEQNRKLNSRFIAIQSLASITTYGSHIHLNDAYLAVDSIDGLLSILVSQAAFRSAERLQMSKYGKSLTPDSISSAALRIPLRSDPAKYLPWLCDLVIPSLHIGHPKLDYIRAWACKAADFYDEEGIFNGIESSISMLKAVRNSITKLSIAMNSLSALSAQVVVDKDKSLDATDKTISASIHQRPSVLKVGIIRGRKSRQGRTFSAQRGGTTWASTKIPPSCDLDDVENIEHDCVEQKLNEAIRLKRARNLGITRDCLTLQNYKSKGDHYVVKELLKSALIRSSLDPSTSIVLVDGLKQFSKDVDVDFDTAMHQFSIELGDSKKDDTPHYLLDAQRLAQWCSSPSVMCLIVLSMLQKALVSIQRPPDLSRIADSAIEAATDDYIRSELKEAARLLSIDYLVRKYCGNGAQEYFRVSNTTHGIRLVQHVCRHVDVDSVLSDVLVLCDAFKDISVVNACVSLLERVSISRGTGRVGQCARIMTTLYSRDALLAEAVGERATSLCAEILEDCKKLILQDSFAVEAKRKAKQIVQVACSILSVMINEAMKLRKARSEYAQYLRRLKQFEIISKLQSDSDIFLTLSESGGPSSYASVVLELLKPIVASSSLAEHSKASIHDLRRDCKPVIRNAKNWCVALCEDLKAEKVWSYAVGTIASEIAKTSGSNASVLLEVSGAFEEGSDAYFQSIIAVVLTLCNEAILQTYQLSKSMLPRDDSVAASLAAMKNMVRASQLLREHAMLSSPANVLPAALSVSTLIELFLDVSVRSDLGVGERLEKEIAVFYPTFQNPISLFQKVLPPSPILHPTWYIGDGLLLQPIDALFGGVSYCQVVSQLEPIGISSTPDDQLVALSEIIPMLETNGAHSTSLRLLAHGNSMSMSITGTHIFDSEIVANNKALSARRSLGGTVAGLTSGNIDSLLSVSFLLHLPKDTAFKIYQASLPSAIGNRDCSRILVLASIGLHLGIGTYSSGVHFSWGKQRRFVDQCNDLFRNAIWWKIFYSYDISFDPSVFSKVSDSTAKDAMQSYCEQLVWKATNKLGPKSVLSLARKFASTFGLDKYFPATALVKFLLSAPETKSKNTVSNLVHDFRCNLILAEDEVRSVLVYMPILNQVKVLRKCVLDLEKDECCAKDYDRHTMALSLYHECLSKLGACMKKSDARKKAHFEEMARIERRQDALVILSSIFDKYSIAERPAYHKMFEQLPEDPSVLLHNNMQHVGVLGSFALNNTFDSLAPLHDVLENMKSSEVLGALDVSLCPLLLLPIGYIHARSLILRLKKLIFLGEDLPSYENAVAPAVKKLAKADDKADLAWWCSQQYSIGSVDQLKCLDLAYTNATLASDEVESLGQRSDEERAALDRVQRIDSARAGLSDKILAEQVLSRHDVNAIMKCLYTEILCEVQKIVSGNENYSPELLVRELLINGSLIAASSALDECVALTAPDFRRLALLVHDACQSLADRYSHVSVGKIARHLMRQWLAKGDESQISDDIQYCNPEYSGKNEGEPLNVSARLEDIEDEFVIDMKMFSSCEQSWANDSNMNSSDFSSSEEPSSMKPLSSSKERYDQMNSRVAHRIAFVICFAKDYHHQNDLSSDDEDENTDKNISKTIPKAKKHRAGLFEGDRAMHHARELLNIVFAREGNASKTSCRPLFDESVSFDNNNSILSTIQEERSYIKEESQVVNKAQSFSFAMRHRAMRVASILCPHDILLRVMAEEGLVSKIDDDVINKFTFVSFVATEIEAMGLPLPHSDLVQLSSSNYASFARTIWRHHGGVSSRGLCGRFYLLLLNLCINNQTSIDWELFLSIFSELKRLELPRSLLLACECAVHSKAIDLAASEGRRDILSCVGDAVNIISSMIINELRATTESRLDQCAQGCLSTLNRLVSLIIAEQELADPVSFVNEYMTMSSHYEGVNQRHLSQGFSEVATRIMVHLTDPEQFCTVTSSASKSDNEHTSEQYANTKNLKEAIEAFERRF